MFMLSYDHPIDGDIIVEAGLADEEEIIQAQIRHQIRLYVIGHLAKGLAISENLSDAQIEAVKMNFTKEAARYKVERI